MTILFINSSLYGRKGQTEHIMNWLKDELGEDDNVVSRYMCDDKIDACRGCNACFTQIRGKCIIKDSVSLYKKYMDMSDLIVIAAPIYINFFPAKLLNFLERLRPFSSGKYAINEQGNFYPVSRHDRVYKFLIVSTCGFPGLQNFTPVKVYFESLFDQYDNYEYMGGMYIPAFKSIFENKNELIPQLKKDIKTTFSKILDGEKSILYNEYVSRDEFKEIIQNYGLLQKEKTN